MLIKFNFFLKDIVITGFCFLLSFIVDFLLIDYLNSKKKFQPARIKGEKCSRVVTFGGLSFLLVFLLFSFYDLKLLIFCILVGLIGFYDDFVKVYRKNYRGIKSGFKFILEIVLCSIYVLLNYKFNFLIFLWRILILVGTINAVNITDGIDSLSSITSIMCLFFLYLKTHNLLAILIIGVLLSFLCFNFPPAKLYMGDVGSLSLGAFISGIFMQNKLELALPLVGFVFVLQTLTSLIQIFSIRIFNIRVFKMAPIHHHLFMSGWTKFYILFFFHFLTLLGFIISIFIFC